MKTDVFRFSVTRTAETSPRDDDHVIEAANSEFQDRLRRARGADDAHKEMRALAKAFVAGDEFASSLAGLDARLAPLDSADPASPGFSALVQSVANASTPAEVAAWARRVDDSLVASIVLADKAHDALPLDRARRLLGAIEAAQGGGREAAASVERTVALAEGLFPLPSAGLHEKAALAARESRERERRELQDARDKLVETLRKNQLAIKELTDTYELDFIDLLAEEGERNVPPPSATTASGTRGGLFALLRRRTGDVGVIEPTRGTALGVLSKSRTTSLSDGTRKALARVGVAEARMNVPHALRALERDSAALAKAFYSGGDALRAVKVAGGFTIPEGAFDGLLIADFDHHVPGACPVPVVAEADLSEATVPNGVGSFESLGVSELMVVKQRLLRYEMGEIAHIENVMATEERSREHRALTRTETLTVEETETTQETVQDLSTTERFELQSESEKTITEDSSRFAGVTVSGSYGPSVNFSANAGFTSAKSKSLASSTAMTHAREVTERSVHRIQERVRRERSTLSINEIEVINRHGFLNRDGEPEHIVGIYRWVDKIYEAQVFNYGKREIIEVVIPEPAALYRHMRTSAPSEGATLRKPLDPGYCTGSRHAFEPLEPKHLNAVSAMFWASVYNAPDIAPPPPKFEVIGVALATKSQEDQPKEAQADNSLKVPQGYVAKRGVFRGNKIVLTSDGVIQNAGLEVTVGRHVMPLSQLKALDNETDTVPIAVLAANTPAFAGTVEVECERTEALYAAWQLKTFFAIMSAYSELRSAYETSLAEQGLTDERQNIRGRNPTVNRQIERREVKRGAISQLTGQHFDDFDAMRKSVGAFAFPQADLHESELEGRYIRFVEQAFEWENMQYLFYPYFWGRKTGWPLVNQLKDEDPLFEAFLQAGSCRVNVPIRPGFENAANAFLSTGALPWTEAGSTVAGREPFLSIAEEMKSQQGAVYVKSNGTLSATQGEAEVTGHGTSFDSDDVRREITIGGDVYMIASVANEESIVLTGRYRGESLVEGEYAIGAKAVGVPWTVRIPTSLVILQRSMELPSFEGRTPDPPG